MFISNEFANMVLNESILETLLVIFSNSASFMHMNVFNICIDFHWGENYQHVHTPDAWWSNPSLEFVNVVLISFLLSIPKVVKLDIIFQNDKMKA